MIPKNLEFAPEDVHYHLMHYVGVGRIQGILRFGLTTWRKAGKMRAKQMTQMNCYSPNDHIGVNEVVIIVLEKAGLIFMSKTLFYVRLALVRLRLS